MTSALNTVWEADPKNIQTFDGGTKADLLGAITTAVNNLDASTQLSIYLDDHGDTHFDIIEYIEASLLADPTSGASVSFSLHSGWSEGLLGNVAQGNEVFPTLYLIPLAPFDPAEWTFTLNGIPLVMPSGTIIGLTALPVDPLSILSGSNLLEIQPVSPSAPSGIGFSFLDLSSGPINELEVPEPGVLLGLISGALLLSALSRGRRTGTGQADRGSSGAPTIV